MLNQYSCSPHSFNKEVCPICSQTLQLGTSETHPTREWISLTYRCEQCGPTQSKLVVHRIPSQGNGLARRVWALGH